MTKSKVFLGWPVGGSDHPSFTRSLLRLQRYEDLHPSEDYELLDPEYVSSLYVQANRNMLVEMAKEAKADWIMQIDSDMECEPYALRNLMAVADPVDKPIVFGVYCNVLMDPVARVGNMSYTLVDMLFREVGNGEYQNIVPTHSAAPFEVDAAGAGIFLCHMSVFEKIPYPWFWLDLILPTDKTKPQIINEDLGFCRVARDFGFHLWATSTVEANHFKTMGLTPSSMRDFLERAQRVEAELARIG